MDSDNEVSLSLTKWPFYLGDALLVGLAVTIATLGDWKLEGIQVVACVLAVALGAALLALPFVTEYLMQVREEKEDRASEIRLFKKQLETVEESLSEQEGRLGKFESRVSLDDQRYELLASAIDQQKKLELPDLTVLIKRIEAIEASAAKQAKMPQKGSKKTDTSLLKRAIREKQDVTSTEVNRIIESKSKPVMTVTPVGGESETVASLKSKKVEGTPEAEKAEPEKPDADTPGQEISSQIEVLPEDFAVSLDADLMIDDALFNVEKTTGPKKAKPKTVKKRVKPNKTTQSAAPADKKKASTSAKVEAATVTVNKLMGIGNKPFLRGSGAGLSWEKGVEMEFQELGKWAWSAPADSGEMVEIQVYRNDEDADRKGKYTLQPEQRLEISPEF